MRVVPASPDAIADAARFLRQGGLVAFPTETVYGLGADATNDLAVAAVFSTKGRPTFNPLIMHVPSLAVAERFGAFDARAKALVAAFWPGPLTLVVPRSADCPVSHLATAGLQSIALRCPAHPVALQLIAQARSPIAAPSANRSGHVSPTTAVHVEADLGPLLDVILDGGPCEVGLESTIIDATGAVITILRPGAITAADLEAVIGAPVRIEIKAKDAADAPLAPGQLESHYAPRAAVRLNAAAPREGEAFLSFGPTGAVTGPHRSLSARADLLEAAANLFAALRDLDALGVASIAVMPIPHEGLGLAINDRLQRAAAPRA
jgi:L-threonylcarbamoyladenylate synthase